MRFKLFVFLLFCGVSHSIAYTGSNIKVTVNIDPYTSEVEQMVYLYTILGNEYCILDSALMGNDVNQVTLKGYIPYEFECDLLFPLRGPVKYPIIARPKEHIKVAIVKEDDKGAGSLVKDAEGALYQKEYVSYWEQSSNRADRRMRFRNAMARQGISDEERAQLADSLRAVEEESRVAIINYATRSESAYNTWMGLSLLKMNHAIDSDSLRIYRQRIRQRFPDYEPLRQLLLQQKLAPASDQSRSNARMIMQMSMERTAFPATKPACIPSIGDTLSLTLHDKDGQVTPLKDFGGKYVLLEFWASWCVPCMKEMPNIQQAQRMFPEDFICCAITLDKNTIPWLNRIQSQGYDDLRHYKGTDAQGLLYPDVAELGISAIPQNYLLDRSGKIVGINVYGEELIKLLEEKD